MKAARYYGPGDIRVENILDPVPTEGQVKVKRDTPVGYRLPVFSTDKGMETSSVCGSDIHAYLMPAPGYASAKPSPITQETAPVTLGHEFSGTIVETGPGVDTTKWTPGTNVVIEPILSCLKKSCRGCSQGSRNLCPNISFIGIGGWGGGLAEYIAVDVRYLHVLPQGIPLDIGACVEPLAVAYYAVKKSGFNENSESALVVGAGPIGLFVVKVLRSLYPAATILVSEPAALRRELALKHGATQVFDPTTVNVPEAIRSIVGDGVDVAYDAAGIQSSMDTSLLSLRARGTYMDIAIWEKKVTLDVNLVVLREITFTGIHAYDRVHEEVISLVASGKIKDIDELITKRISLDDIVEEGILKLISEKDKQVKILVHP